ncbi:hydroxyacylglutathione hydrolase, mitochondrial isoform X1 [Patella vulgata]|nr:hydroxyacylglutathione hydrolase, mitochondrial isoform X1 [Patella vulgata]
MKIRIIPALEDNYMYLLIDEKTNQCAAIDPVEPKKIQAAVQEEKVKLTSVLTTHHHWDHAGGNEQLVDLMGKVNVYGGDDRIGALTHKVKHGENFKIGELDIKCLSTPCHTSGHICYFVTSSTNQQPAVFTGDTLFVAGCGKFFEGTPEQMHHALIEVLAKLPSNTTIYCGHEYTVSNLRFASNIEPDNPDVQNKLDWSKKQRSERQVTIPSTIQEELTFNPFMRVSVASVQKKVEGKDEVDTMGKLREAKNRFKV